MARRTSDRLSVAPGGTRGGPGRGGGRETAQDRPEWHPMARRTSDRLSVALVGTRGVPARYGGFETAIEEVGRRLAGGRHRGGVHRPHLPGGPAGAAARH